jgi:lipopolysaccharide assembly protein A
MKYLWWATLVLVAVVVILFAISNRETISIGLWPLPVQLELPLYLLILGTLLFGFVVGEVTGRIGSWRFRREARRGRERIAVLERELETERAQRGVAVPVAAISR